MCELDTCVWLHALGSVFVRLLRLTLWFVPTQMMAVPALEARVEAWRFAERFAGRADALGGAAALLTTACGEVQQSELLRTLLKVALLAGEREGGAGHAWVGPASVPSHRVHSADAADLSAAVVHIPAPCHSCCPQGAS